MATLCSVLLYVLVVPAGAGAQKQSKKDIYQSQFVVAGTVFTEKGFALPNAQIKIRLLGKRKARWEALSNSRGEFAVRVRSGAQYDLEISAKGYQTIARKVDAQQPGRQDLVFRMTPMVEGKKGK